MSKVLGFVLLGLIILIGCTTMVKVQKNPVYFDAIVQLHDVSDSDFYCSATVVSKKYAVTAGHCTVGMPEILIYDKNGKNTGVIAVPVRASGQMDYAVLKGDFSHFRFIVPELSVHKVIDSFVSGDDITCGFPMGGNLICLGLKSPRQDIFFFNAEGFLYPGMSGGPVIDKNTGRLIGVNSAATENGVILSPIINLLFGLDL